MGSTSYEGDFQNIENPSERMFGVANALMRRDSHGTHTSTTRSGISKHLDVEELEMLLEAYFVQIDGTLNKLSTVCLSNLICLINFSSSILSYQYVIISY